MVIEHADFEGIERISAAVGAEILSTFNNPERASKILGRCDLIEEIMIGEDKMIKFSGCAAGNFYRCFVNMMNVYDEYIYDEYI